MKLLFASVAIALAGNSAPALPQKLPTEIGGFAFGDTVDQLRAKCDKLPARKGKGGMARFFVDAAGKLASCEDVKTGKAYLPAVAELYFRIGEGGTRLVEAEVPMATLTEYARAILRDGGNEVKGGVYCKRFSDGVGAVCVQLDTKALSFLLRPDG